MKPRRIVKMFLREFIPAIRSGTKVTTIRRIPKRSRGYPRSGDTLDIRAWIGTPYRSKQERIGEAEIVRWVRIEVSKSGIFAVRLDGEHPEPFGVLNPEDSAIRDGFKSWEEMLSWFERMHGLPFFGIRIDWRNFKPAEGAR